MYMYISITYSVLLRYGMHESFDYYINCRLRKRNRGLFYADRVRKPCHQILYNYSFPSPPLSFSLYM